jgi:hypothetical protein
MKTRLNGRRNVFAWNLLLAGALLAGVASIPGSVARAAEKAEFGTAEKKEFKRTDKLDRVWLAEGFDFTGYDALLVDDVKPDPAVKPKDETEADRLSLMQGSMARDLVLAIETRKLFKTVTLKPSDIPAGTKAVKLQTTIMKFSRGSTAARVGVGFGAGMPYVRVIVTGSELGSGRPLFEVELDETADWFGAGYSSSKTLQSGAAMELTADLANYMARVASHDPIKYKTAKPSKGTK